MKSVIAALYEHPRIVALAGSVAGWFSAENISRAKDAAQAFASLTAALVSLCALILTAPAAVTKIRGWIALLRSRRS